MLDLSPVFATFPLLETERFRLRQITPDDAADIFHILSSPQVHQHLGRQPMTSMEEAERRVQAYRATFDRHEGIPWAITRRGERPVIGTVVFWHLNPDHYRAELGYLLAPEWWGQGIATEAAQAVLAFGFTTMGLHSVEAQTAPENIASRRVLEKLGFVQEGYFRENFYDPVTQQFGDTVVYSLLKAAWLAGRQGQCP
ncbi:MAG: GNAT family N-acetyltransferase [Chloroflexi bacterium]|nr:GNAT family N-acetyltransferase [Chloroflexota bacterium]